MQPETRLDAFSGLPIYGLLVSGWGFWRLAARHALGEALVLLFLQLRVFLPLRGGKHLEGGVAGLEHLQFAFGVLAFQLGAFLLALGDELARGLFVKIFAVQQLLLLALALRHFLLELGVACGGVFRLPRAVLRHDVADFVFLRFAQTQLVKAARQAVSFEFVAHFV